MSVRATWNSKPESLSGGELISGALSVRARLAQNNYVRLRFVREGSSTADVAVSILDLSIAAEPGATSFNLLSG